MNFAVWAKPDRSKRDYSKICENIELTSSVNFSEYKNIIKKQPIKLIDMKFSSVNFAGTRIKYGETEFYNFDCYLQSLSKHKAIF